MGTGRRFTVIAATLGASILAAAPAEAAKVYHGKDSVTVGATGDYNCVWVYDGENDDHWVYGNWYQGPGSGMYSLINTKGYDSYEHVYTSYWVTTFRVCEYSVGCSGWEVV